MIEHVHDDDLPWNVTRKEWIGKPYCPLKAFRTKLRAKRWINSFEAKAWLVEQTNMLEKKAR